MSTRRIVSIASALLMLPAFAVAAPIPLSNSRTFNMNVPLHVEGDTAYGGMNLTLGQFDPSLGTLLSVDIGIDAWVTHTFGIEATTAGLALADGVIEMTHTGEELQEVAPPPSIVASCTAVPGASDPRCHASTIHTTRVVWDANYTDPFHLTNLTGSGVFYLILQSYFQFELNDAYEAYGYNQIVTMDASWLGSASVTYTYEPLETHSVDEPGTLALVMAGLIAGMWRPRPKSGFR